MPSQTANKMKIGYIVPSCSVSGGMAVICQHANRLLKRGHEVVLLSIVDIRPMDWFPHQQVPIHDAASWDGDLDVVVATGWSTAFWLPRLAARVKCYFVQSDETRFHPDDSRWQHLTALTYYFGAHYLTEARWIRTWLKNSFGHDAELVPNGLDAEIFGPATPLEPKGKKPRILLEGAIGLPYKGMREAFEAVQDIHAEVWCVSSYGEPEPHWHCDRFFEHVPMQDMRKIYSSCDILLKLSRVEGFFGPPMEMMACGGVAVVGRVTGYDEYIVEEQNALVVDALDISAARAAVQRLIDDEALRNRLIAAGAQTAREWDWESSIDTLEAYYSKLVSDPKNWYDNSLRPKYDRSITFAYDMMSRGILPEDIAPATPGEAPKMVAPHVQRVAVYMANSTAFKYFADLLRFGYRGYKKCRGIAGRVKRRLKHP
ncbi:hypothetical protein CV044_07115 [Achromobacter ruhlandii]|nr:hypothetical protein CV044_07115 [Achromobacter ruhlandii]